MCLLLTAHNITCTVSVATATVITIMTATTPVMIAIVTGLIEPEWFEPESTLVWNRNTADFKCYTIV